MPNWPMPKAQPFDPHRDDGRQIGAHTAAIAREFGLGGEPSQGLGNFVDHEVWLKLRERYGQYGIDRVEGRSVDRREGDSSSSD